MPETSIRVRLQCRLCSRSFLRDTLAAVLPADVELLLTGDSPLRGLDTSVLVALVAAGGTAVGALITGLFRVGEQVGAKKLVMVGKSGRRVEVPLGVSPAELQAAINAAKELDLDEIIVA